MRRILAILVGFLANSSLAAQEKTPRPEELGNRTLLLFDVSASMVRIADSSNGKTRQDAVLDFLSDEKSAFLTRVQTRGPVVAYRFGLFCHFEPIYLYKGKVFSPREWASVEADPKNLDRAGNPWKRGDWEAWLKPNLDLEPPKGLSLQAERDWFNRQVALIRASAGTDTARSILEAFRDQGKHRVLGIVVFGDGRDTVVSQATTSLEQAARLSGTPVFAVPIGGDVAPLRVSLAGVRAPTHVLPGETFSVLVGVSGVGLAGKTVPVTLRFTPPGEQEQSREITLTFKDDLAQVEHAFRFDAGKAEGSWTFVAQVPPLKGETVQRRPLQSPPVQVQVQQRRPRVLLMADSAVREYQFLRQWLLRAADRGQVELSVLLQARARRERDDEPGYLSAFPHRLGERARLSDAEKATDLSSYDLIIAIDPDWSRLGVSELKNLHDWVTKWGGGLVVAAGAVNTPALAQAKNAATFKPLLDLLPVVPEDFKDWEEKAQSEEPRILKLEQGLTFPFLFLGEKIGKDYTREWLEFFHGDSVDKKEKSIEAGFFSFYPIRETRGKATVLARVADEKVKNKKGQLQPYLVHHSLGKGQVLWLGSAESWRLRQVKESFHENFWARLIPALSGSLGETGVDRLMVPQGGTRGVPTALEVRLQGKDGKPLPAGSRVLAHFEPALDGEHATVQLRPVKSGEWTGLFRLDFTPPAARAYRVRVHNPARGTSLLATFSVTDIEPELRELRADPANLRRLATPAEPVLKALPQQTRETLAKLLGTPARLAIPLKSAAILPEAIGLKEVRVQTLAQVFDRRSQPDLQFAEIKVARKVKVNSNVEFSVTVRNPASIDVTAPLLRVFVDGEEDFLGATVVGKVEAGKTTTVSFALSFARVGKRKVELRLQGGKSDGRPLIATLEIEVEK